MKENSMKENAMMTIDPVCGMEVDEQESEFQSQYGNKKFYFCSEECLTTFERRPEKYSRAAAKAA